MKLSMDTKRKTKGVEMTACATVVTGGWRKKLAQQRGRQVEDVARLVDEVSQRQSFDIETRHQIVGRRKS